MTRREAFVACGAGGAGVVAGALLAAREPPRGRPAGEAPGWTPSTWHREYPGGWVAEVRCGRSLWWCAFRAGGPYGYGDAPTLEAAMEAADRFVREHADG